MDYKVGKILKFDNYAGIIVDDKNEYLFLDTDLEDNVEVDDLVRFQSEKVNDTNRAYFVKKLSKKGIN